MDEIIAQAEAQFREQMAFVLDEQDEVLCAAAEDGLAEAVRGIVRGALSGDCVGAAVCGEVV